MDKTSLESQHPQLEQFATTYIKTSDCANGQDAVKSAGERYLPKLPGHEVGNGGQILYNLYKNYAVYFPGVGRTVDGYMGLAFRKAPVFSGKIGEFEKDVTLDGEPIDSFARKLLRDMVVRFRPGILVDMPVIDTEQPMTVSEMSAVARPYFTIYSTDSILDWRESFIGGRVQTTFVKLFESEYRPTEADPLKYEKVSRVRVLSLTDQGIYRQQAYELVTVNDNDKKQEYQLITDVEPVINGKKLNYIPFIPASKNGIEWGLDYSPINDLSDISIAHYRNSASYQNGVLISGCPTLCVAGLLPDSKDGNGNIVMGASTVMQFETGGNAWFAQIGTEGLAETRLSMDRLEKQMALLGSRILQGDNPMAEAAQTAGIHRSGENGVLANICNIAAMAITEALKIVAEWTGYGPENISYEMNTDFEDQRIDPSVLASLMQALQAGLISKETFYHNLKRGEVYEQGRTFKDEMAAIERDMTDSFGVADQRYQELTAKIEALQPTADTGEAPDQV